MEIFGIDKKLKSSFSSFGLKSVNSDSILRTGLRKNGIDPKDLQESKRRSNFGIRLYNTWWYQR